MSHQTTYHNYIFFAAKDSVVDLAPVTLKKYKDDFHKALKKTGTVRIYTYSTLGLKADTLLMFWLHSDSLEANQTVISKLTHTRLGQHLHITYTLFGMTRDSVYRSKPTANNESLDDKPRLTYLVIYPFTKTKEWYALDLEKRKDSMNEHMKIGFKYKHIRQLLLYAFGVDDHEFIVSYETESLPDFQSLVMDLRSTEARLYTKNDTPIFTCVYKPIEKALDMI